MPGTQRAWQMALCSHDLNTRANKVTCCLSMLGGDSPVHTSVRS